MAFVHRKISVSGIRCLGLAYNTHANTHKKAN